MYSEIQISVILLWENQCFWTWTSNKELFLHPCRLFSFSSASACWTSSSFPAQILVAKGLQELGDCDQSYLRSWMDIPAGKPCRWLQLLNCNTWAWRLNTSWCIQPWLWVALILHDPVLRRCRFFQDASFWKLRCLLRGGMEILSTSLCVNSKYLVMIGGYF